MGDLAVPLLIIAGLVLVNAAFAGSEMALVSLREGQLQRLEQRGGKGRALVALARDPNRFLTTVQIGVTLAGFLASAVATATLVGPLSERLAFLGRAAQPGALFGVTFLLTFVTLVGGELAPKRVALQRAEGWGLLVARPFAVTAKVSAPLVWVLGRCTDLVVRLAGGDPAVQREEVTEEELRDMLAAQPGFTPQQRTIVAGAFEIDDRRVRSIMVPRGSVFALDAHLSADEAVEQLVASGHSRAPVYRGTLDGVVGVAHLRDLVRADGTVGDHVRGVAVLPESVDVLGALRTLREGRQQLAVVIDEYGGVDGMVTLEDLLEEIVGELYDEFDRDLDVQDPRSARRQPDGSIVVPGAFPLHDLVDLDVHVPPGDYATVAGLVLHRLGHLPVAGEATEESGWRLEVLRVRARAIDRVRLTAVGDGGSADDAAAGSAGGGDDR